MIREARRRFMIHNHVLLFLLACYNEGHVIFFCFSNPFFLDKHKNQILNTFVFPVYLGKGEVNKYLLALLQIQGPSKAVHAADPECNNNKDAESYTPVSVSNKETVNPRLDLGQISSEIYINKSSKTSSQHVIAKATNENGKQAASDAREERSKQVRGP